MRYENPFSVPVLSGLFETLLPDFVLGFAFFTALAYGVLSRRFDHQRAAAAMSAALGAALAVGLVWWEYDHGWSIRNLGPAALVLAVLILAGTIYHAVRHIGGCWAGIGITLGLSLLVGGIVGADATEIAGALETVAIVALIVGLLLFLMHNHVARVDPRPPSIWQCRQQSDESRQEIARLHRDRWFSGQLTRGLRRLRNETKLLTQQPQELPDVADQIKRLLPAEGWLTQRMARLRAKAHHVRKGHLARLEETRDICRTLEPSAKRRTAANLVRQYHQLAGMDKRLERLDRAVATNERRIRHLTLEAERATTRHDFQELVELLTQAERLQGHNEKIFKAIERTERKLADVAQAAAREAREVSRP